MYDASVAASRATANNQNYTIGSVFSFGDDANISTRADQTSEGEAGSTATSALGNATSTGSMGSGKKGGAFANPATAITALIVGGLLIGIIAWKKL